MATPGKDTSEYKVTLWTKLFGFLVAAASTVMQFTDSAIFSDAPLWIGQVAGMVMALAAQLGYTNARTRVKEAEAFSAKEPE